jgi:hypothetical protein
MKTYRTLLLSAALAGIVISSCDELLSDLLKFNTQWYTVDFSISPDQIGDETFKSEELSVDVDSVLEANGISRDLISSIRISDARVSILTPGQKFDPLDKLEINLSTEALGSKLVAWTDTIPATDTILVMELNRDDLQDYLLEDRFTVTASGNLNSRVSQVVDLRAELRWVISGKLTEE